MELLQIASVNLVYYKVRLTIITNCVTFFITKYVTVYYKLRKLLQSAMDLLQIATAITKCDGFITNWDSLVYYKVRWTVITNCVTFFITKYVTVYYKLRQLLQSAMIITNCNSTFGQVRKGS